MKLYATRDINSTGLVYVWSEEPDFTEDGRFVESCTFERRLLLYSMQMGDFEGDFGVEIGEGQMLELEIIVGEVYDMGEAA